jgi:hypothetical protein
MFLLLLFVFLSISDVYAQSLSYDFVYRDLEKTTGEFSLSFGQLNFSKEWKDRAYYQLELMERNEKYGIAVSLGWANVDSETFIKNFINYRESIDFVPIELNGKRFFNLNTFELGIGVGVSMNYLSYNLDKIDLNKNVGSKNRMLFGFQGMIEFKMLFPTSYGRNAFAGIEGKYQWVDRANTFFENKNLSNYRIILKLGGIF